MEVHGHDYLQIIHVVEGDFAVDWGDGWQIVKPGCAHILPGGFSHSLRTTHGHKQFGLNFNTLKDAPTPLHALLCRRFTRPCIQPVEFTTPMRHYLESPPILPDELTQLKIIHMFDSYSLDLLDSLSVRSEIRQKKQLLGFLEENAAEPLTVTEISDAMSMSRASLQRFCAETFNCGVKTLHERIRIEHAARLLYQTELSISECARACGYSDIYAFSRSFKRIKGISPSKHANLHS